MELILNDFSLSGQYSNVDEFADDVSDNMLPLLVLADKKEYPLFKKQDAYNLPVCYQTTLKDVFTKYGSKYPDISKFKSLLNRVLWKEEPFWDQNPKTDLTAEFELQVPNCMSETFYRKGILISFVKSKFNQDTIFLVVNKINEKIPNATTSEKLIERLIEVKEISFPHDTRFKFAIHCEDNMNHHKPHFHITNGIVSSIVQISDFDSAEKAVVIHRELIDGVNLAKKYKQDLIDIWNSLNPHKLYKQN